MCYVLVASSALIFVVSFVKIIIERSFVPQVPFEESSTLGRGERPEEKKKPDKNWRKLKKSPSRTAYGASSYSQSNWLCGSHV